MGSVKVVQAINRALALEMAGRIGKGLEALEEIAKRCFDMPLKRLTVSAQNFTLGGLQASKSQAIAKACRLRRLSLFCWHFLHFKSPCAMQFAGQLRWPSQ